MITFEGEYKSFKARIFSQKTLGFLFVFIFYSYIFSRFFEVDTLKYYTYFLEFVFFVLFITVTINTSKNIIDKISIDENNITLSGENFNENWKKSLNIKETNIQIRINASQKGIRGSTFYLKIKNKKDNYTINSFETYTDEGIMHIFNAFKKFKDEKIIIDERLVILQIQEKIEKCR
ncbi:hypothetical protein [Flavobacterium sp. JAS]|uniref:hypothetical protein n=1 Tax=Flavobacterium sp. JAS TaxID=2897329 RepID=UPI001E4F47D5|nr:hypothetical protein [Flavobacterium sp. JAS]MCD0472007.1 hypothetical protein [Flavobacterium sp. JAS]